MSSSPLILDLPKLKKVISKSNIRHLLISFNQADQGNFSILDSSKSLLLGESTIFSNHYQTEIVLDGELLGYIEGDRPRPEVAELIVYCMQQEITEKGLAKEALSKYEEINFLYDLSKTLMLCKTVQEVTQLSMYESRKLISATGGSILLFNAETNYLEIAANWGDTTPLEQPIEPGQGIQGCIFLAGKAEIVNNVPEDTRHVPASHPIQSLMCAPLVSPSGVLGVINLFHSRPFFYTANEQKLLVMIAEQTGMVLENLILQTGQENKSKEDVACATLQQTLQQIQSQLSQHRLPDGAEDLERMIEVNSGLTQALQQMVGLLQDKTKNSLSA